MLEQSERFETLLIAKTFEQDKQSLHNDKSLEVNTNNFVQHLLDKSDNHELNKMHRKNKFVFDHDQGQILTK